MGIEGVDPLDALLSYDDATLARAVAALRAEQQRRALESGDVDAVVEDAFTRGFDGPRPRAPYLHGGLLVCPGAKTEKSSGHDCSFCSVDGTWAWEHPDKVADQIRGSGTGRGRTMLTVTVIPAWEGLEVDQVESRASRGAHEMRRATGYTVTGGTLAQSSRRIRAAGGHSR